MFVRKVWRQSNSLAIVIPKELCRATRIVEGCHVVMSLGSDGVVQFERLIKRNTDLPVKGGSK